MKNIVTILFASIFLMSTANAGGMIGIKAGVGDLDGTRTSSVDAKGGASSASVDSEYGAIFAEVNLADNIAVGLEIVPMEGVIDTKSTTGTDSQVTVEDLMTLYVLALRDTSFGSVYGKIGYASADLSVVANYGQTITDASDAAEGPMIGIGAQFSIPTPVIDTMRIEGTYTKFDDLKITSDGDKRTGDAELTTLSISLARSF